MANAFDTTGPSIFCNDKSFAATKTGKSLSEAARQGVDTFRANTGICKGTIPGLSVKAEKQRKRWPEAKKGGA